jgi:hypothetical protein
MRGLMCDTAEAVLLRVVVVVPHETFSAATTARPDLPLAASVVEFRSQSI